MSIKQVCKFIQESIGAERKWESIRVLGGEPTLHPHILEILDLFVSYKNNHFCDTKIVLVTNGYGEHVNKILNKIPHDIIIENSAKISSKQTNFSPVTLAPCDMENCKNFDYSRGCWIPTLCGIALDVHGYYACSFAAAADRAIGLDVGKKSINETDNLDSQFHFFCKYCGHFCDKINEIISEECVDLSDKTMIEKIHKEKFESSLEGNHYEEHAFSSSWRDFLRSYKALKPAMSKY
jgi:hypothetical protein